MPETSCVFHAREDVRSGPCVLTLAQPMKNRRTAPRRLLAAAMMAGLSSPGIAAESIHAFGGRNIATPSSVQPNAILSRYTFTPTQLCGQARCEITVAALYNKGSVFGGDASGPELETDVPGVSLRLLLDGTPVSSRYSGTFSDIAEIQLFRNSGRIASGEFASGSFNAYYILTYRNGIIWTDSTSIKLQGSVTAIDGTCTVPDQNVKLPPINTAHLRGIDTTAADTPFELAITTCPRGFNRVGYTILPVGGALAEGSGILPLLPESTATGASIRVTDSSGTPLEPGVSLPVAAYGKDAGGSFKIPMIASYVQTAGHVTGGSVQAGILISIDYQ
jgi:major type 1 subunit fimbrin (pilin)